MTAILSFLRIAWPYILAASIGFGGAWKVQGYRITGLEQAHSAYVQKQVQENQAAQAKADQQREQSAKDYAHVSDILSDEINRGVVYKRCVAAGKCGLRVTAYRCNVPAVSPGSGNNAASADAVPAATEHADTLNHNEDVLDMVDPVVNDCAKTTLMLNQLQAAIRGQDGY